MRHGLAKHCVISGSSSPHQATFWDLLRKPSSEKFFAEIHKCFMEAEVVIKNNPMALVMQQDEEGHTLLVSSVDAKGGPKAKTSTLVSQLSFDQRDINVCLQIFWAIIIHICRYLAHSHKILLGT